MFLLYELFKMVIIAMGKYDFDALQSTWSSSVFSYLSVPPCKVETNYEAKESPFGVSVIGGQHCSRSGR